MFFKIVKIVRGERAQQRALIFLLALLITASLSFLLAGCGGEKSYEARGKVEDSKSADQGKSSNEGVNFKSDGVEVKYSENPKKSVTLPENYPAGQFPVYKDSFIAAVTKDENSTVVICFSKDGWEKVAAYYKELFSAANVISEYEDAGGFTSWGVKDGYNYNFTVGESDEMEGYRTTFALMLMPAEEEMEEFLKQMPSLPGSN